MTAPAAGARPRVCSPSCPACLQEAAEAAANRYSTRALSDVSNITGAIPVFVERQGYRDKDALNANRDLPELPADKDRSPSVPATPSLCDSPSSARLEQLPRTPAPEWTAVPPPLEVDGEESEPEFTEYRPPSQEQLRQAATFELLDENGKTVWFRELYPDAPGVTPPPRGRYADEELEPKTVVFFIRALGCGQCQDYMLASIARLDPEEVAAAKVRVVIITNGSWKGISRYRELMGSRFPIYVDPELKLYKLLGMTPPSNALERIVTIFRTPPNRPEYHQHAAIMQTLRGLRNAAKLGVLNIGSPSQMGGEFVLLPGYRCTYAHRMPDKFHHKPAPTVLRKAGVTFPEGRSVVTRSSDESNAMRFFEDGTMAQTKPSSDLTELLPVKSPQ